MLVAPKLRICRSESIPRQPHCCVSVHAARPQLGLTPGPIQNISDVAQGPAVRSVIPWVRFVGTKRGKHAPMSDMTRREFITLIGGAAAAWPLAAGAQQSAMPVIGLLHSASAGAFAPFLAALREGLGEAGYVDGQNVRIEFRWAEGQYDRLPAMAAELVDQKVTLIIAGGGDRPTLAAKAVTTTIPIVFTGSDDPVLFGLVTSLSRPGGNVTGVGVFQSELEVKRFMLLRELAPAIPRIAMLVNPNSPTPIAMLGQWRRPLLRLANRLISCVSATNGTSIRPSAPWSGGGRTPFWSHMTRFCSVVGSS